jgi:nucleoside-diphosphate-sugar epimerase
MKCVDLDIQEPLNLGWGRPTSFNELAELFFIETGWRPEGGITHLLDKPKGVLYRCADPSRMLKYFKPQITLEMGIRECLEEYGRYVR